MNTGNTSRRMRTTLTAGASALGMAALAACGAADTGAASGGSDTVTIAVPSWVGAEANAAVAKHLLEEELDVEAELRQMDEPVAWDALDSGKADAILEDWGGVPKKEKRYVEERKTVVPAGDLGVTGHIGWFVPKYFADEHPDVTDWKNLDKYADELRTTESNGKGQLLEGSPSYTTHDDAIIKNLGLNLKTVYAGSESAQITQIRKYVEERKPFLTYWWTPQWLNAEIDFVEVELPEHTEGCDADPEEVACGYPDTPLQKYLNADFAENGGDAAEFLKNFRWSTEQQNQVAKWIAGDGMSAEDAAAKWVKENKDTWEKWLPKK
ncbi:ABC transporter substrate-binding protein [Streptomyces desertarenae]|uniref:ABC transporter substrate-binding protein n=1 Tax=Streptomyces desertarenae TaxID=2666184 RepID=A0ABW4PJY6_9ACTN